MKSPAPTSSMTASATSATTSTLRSRCARPPAVVERPPSFSAPIRSGRADCSAGTMPKTMPVSDRGGDRGARARASRSDRRDARQIRRAATRAAPASRRYASTTPSAAPPSESTTPSTSSPRDEPPAARAERGADPHLAAAPGRARQQQVRDVGARDEQHQRDRAEQHQHPAAHLAHEMLVQRDDARAAARAPLRILLVELLATGVTSARAPAASDTPSFSRPIDGAVEVAAVRLDAICPSVGTSAATSISVGRSLADRIGEAARHDADDLVGVLARDRIVLPTTSGAPPKRRCQNP